MQLMVPLQLTVYAAGLLFLRFLLGTGFPDATQKGLVKLTLHTYIDRKTLSAK
jgi:hypothetical protein